MKFTILQENLLKALVRTGRILSNKPQLPILQNVLFSAADGEVQIASSNLEMTIIVKVGAKIEKEGSITIPSKILTEFITSLPQETVSFSVKEESTTIRCAGYEAVLPGMPPEEFPPILNKKQKDSKKIEKDLFMSSLQSVLFSAASDEGRPLLTGIKITKKDGETLFVSTDGYRLSLKKTAISFDDGVDMVIPAKALTEIVKISHEEKETKDITLSVTPEGQLMFVCGDTEIQTRRIDGEYPNFSKIIPSTHTTRAQIDREKLVRAVKSAAIFARDNANILRLHIEDGKIVVSANAPSIGENKVELDAVVDGDGGDIAFNSRFLLELLANYQEEEIVFEMTGSLNSGVFKNPNDPSYLHIIMPVRVQG